MVRVGWIAVGIELELEAVPLKALLAAVVARRAQGLQLPQSKKIVIAAVRLSVIRNGCGRDLAACQAEFAQRLDAQLLCAPVTP
jgi:hypothetical protein